MNGYANNRGDSRFFNGDRSELQAIKSKESLQKFHKHNRTRKQISRLTRMLVFLLLGVVFVVLCLNLFFRIETIEVVGSGRYSAQDVLDAAGIEKGQSLFLVSDRDFDGLPARLAYIEDARITRRLPSTLIITLTEDTPRYVLELYGEYFELSTDLRVLARAFDRDSVSEGLCDLVLPELDAAIVGSKLVFTDEADEKYVRSYLSLMESSTLYDRITGIDLRDKFDLAILCDGIYLVNMGDSSDLDVKLDLTYGMLGTEAFDGVSPAILDVTNPQTGTANFAAGNNVAFEKKT
ncbi:MAG: FtsQ-type POTRA domain-containing protein [Clostridia bacterium]|nr:FtsQ-type POTRA domain-containing protein [Clostridia bacterium]